MPGSSPPSRAGPRPPTGSMPSVRSRLLRGGSWALVGHVGQAALPMAQYALLARLLAPDDLGAYFIALSVANLMASIACLGIPTALVRFIAGSVAQGEPRPIRGTLVKGRVFAFGVSATLSMLLCGPPGVFLAEDVFASPAFASSLPWLSLWGTALSQHRITIEGFRGFGDMRNVALLGQIAPAGGACLFFLVLASWSNVLHVDTVVAVSACTQVAFSTIGLLGLYLRWLRRLPRAPADFANLLRVSWFLGAEGIASLAMSQAHLWLLAAVSTDTQVAIFSAAARLTALVTFPLVIAAAAVPPLVSELYTQHRFEQLERMLRAVASLTALPALAILLPLTLLGGSALSLLYGEFYASGHTTLAILALGQIVSALSGVPGLALQMTKGERLRFLLTVASGLTGLLATWLGLRMGEGAHAAAVGITLSLSAQNVTSVLAARKTLGIWTHASFEGLSEARGLIRTSRARLMRP